MRGPRAARAICRSWLTVRLGKGMGIVRTIMFVSSMVRRSSAFMRVKTYPGNSGSSVTTLRRWTRRSFL